MKMVTVLKKRDKVTSQATDRAKNLAAYFPPKSRWSYACEETWVTAKSKFIAARKKMFNALSVLEDEHFPT